MKKVTKTLIIISIIIIVLGIFAGISVNKQLSAGVSEMENQYVDGSNFTPLVQFGVTLGALAVSFAIIFYSVLAVCAIWVIYGMIILIIKILNKISQRKHPTM